MKTVILRLQWFTCSNGSTSKALTKVLRSEEQTEQKKLLNADLRFKQPKSIARFKKGRPRRDLHETYNNDPEWQVTATCEAWGIENLDLLRVLVDVALAEYRAGIRPLQTKAEVKQDYKSESDNLCAAGKATTGDDLMAIFRGAVAGQKAFIAEFGSQSIARNPAALFVAHFTKLRNTT